MKSLRIETKKEGDTFFNFLPCYNISYTSKVEDGSVEIVRKAMEIVKDLYWKENEN